MITSIQGQVAEKGADHIIVVVGGVGLHVNVPESIKR